MQQDAEIQNYNLIKCIRNPFSAIISYNFFRKTESNAFT
jgi:hypothetical protein